MPISLAKIKDVVLPGLWGMDPEGRSDLYIDYVADTINLRIGDQSSVLLTRKDIDDDVWRAVAGQKLQQAFKGDKK